MEAEVPVGVPAHPPAEVIAEADRTARRAAHEWRVDGWIAPWLAGRARGEKHPVEDFLFEYSSYSPAKPRRRHPGAGVLPERRRRELAAVLEAPQVRCLHANMDPYKWAYRLVPLVDSDLVADCFALARGMRALDMRVSPYDPSALGSPPVPVETAAGRQEDVRRQRDFAARAAALRTRLLAACDRVEAR
ncbi:MAG: hypothetical protein ACJ73S_23750 [Mycobacteriales bacterium]